MKLLLALLLICMGPIGAQKVSAQACCGLGSAAASGSHVSATAGSFVLITTASYAASGPQYTGTGGSVDLANRDVRRAEVLIDIGYGFTDRLSANISGGLLWKSKEFTFFIPGGSIRDNPTSLGISDGLLTLKYAIIPLTVLTLQELKAAVVTGIPWGRTDQENDGVRLQRDVQTGLGAWTVGGFVSYYYAIPGLLLGFSGQAAFTGRLPGADEYDYGDESHGQLGIQVGPWQNFRAMLAISTRYAATDSQGEKELTGTGGMFLDLIPGLQYKLGESMNLHIEAELPAWRNVNGTQLTKAYALRLSAIVYLAQ